MYPTHWERAGTSDWACADEAGYGQPGGDALELPWTAVTDADTPLRVLVVDDEPFTLKALKRLLKKHHVDVASNGREALALFDHDGPYDVILCDVMMPELTGVDVYRHVAQRSPGAEERIVFVSGGAFGAEIVAFIESVPNTMVTKPFDRDELCAVVERIGRRGGQ